MTPTEAKRARWAVAAMFAINGFTMGAWAPQIPLMLTRHQISEAILGYLILGLGLGAVGAMAFSGALIQRFGALTIMRVFAMALLPMLPLVVLAPSVWTVAPAMVLFGAVTGTMDVAMNANAVEVERRLGRAVMSSSHGFWSLGGFIGGTSGGWLIGQTSPMTEALIAMAVMVVVLALVWPHMRGEPVAPAATRSGPRGPLLPREIGIWLLGAMALFSMMPEGAVLDWAAIYLKKELGASPFVSGLGFAFFSATMALVRFAGDGIRNRLGAVRTVRVSGLVGMAGLLLAALSQHPAPVILGFAIAGLGVANMVPVMMSAAGNAPGHAAGSAIALVTMVGYAGILVAPAMIGWVAEHTGFRPTYIGLSLLLGVVSLLAGRTAMADHPAKDTPPKAP